MDIQIVYASSGLGLKKDASILESALNAMGHSCQQVQLHPTPAWRNKLSYFRYRLLNTYCPKPIEHLYYPVSRWFKAFLNGAPKADLVIHLENIRPSYLSARSKHWLIPNQEWFIESRSPYLAFIDRVLCKTHHAQTVFSSLHPRTCFLGFTSSTNATATVIPNKDYKLAIHVAGNSQFKGTDILVNTWRQHPDWPSLVVVSKHTEQSQSNPDNLKICKDLGNEELSRLWQEAGFAIIPSEVEGYGHVLAEAMSHGCVTITTDAPPMNELINKDRGFLIPSDTSQPFRLGTRYQVSAQSLEQAISEALNTDEARLRHLSQASVMWYEHNHAAFLQRLKELTNQLSGQPLDRSLKEFPEM